MYLLLAIEIGVTANNSVRLWGCTTLKIGKPSRDRSSVTPRSLRRLHWMLIPGPIGARCVTVDHLQLDLGSVEPFLSW